MNRSQWQEWQDVGYVTAFYVTIYGKFTKGRGDRTPSPSQARWTSRSPSPGGKRCIFLWICAQIHSELILSAQKVHPVCPNRSSHMLQLLVLAFKRHVPAFYTQLT